ncbi:MAG: aspartate carbamoyltransferase catalytic subunit [Candidatus Dadabacteria bacterium]|nr:MAG: aspartate carbamoyltransferase catalytic subunit [Candidatus Dadabacteria bacterium]
MKRHLISIKDLRLEEARLLLENGKHFLEISERKIKKTPALRGKTVINLFFEPSTRTRTSFEIAAKRLSADAVNINISASSVKKGETILDTALTLEAMAPDVLVVRHSEAGVPLFLANYLKDTSIINAGDGCHEHPTQALLDALALMEKFGGRFENLTSKKITIVGDILHSRVARSTIYLHSLLGNSINLVGPPPLVPQEFKEKIFSSEIKIHYNLASAIKGADIIMVLRVQKERQNECFISSLEEYSRIYCLTPEIVKKYAPKAIIMHPGPVNRGIDLTGSLIEAAQALIQDQVRCGVAIRMAVLLWACMEKETAKESSSKKKQKKVEAKLSREINNAGEPYEELTAG